MASFKKEAGDGWRFEVPLIDSDGNAITSLDDAWFSIYEDQDNEIVFYELSDSQVTLSTSTLVIIVPEDVTTLISDGSYFLDVKIKPTGGIAETVIRKTRVRCNNDHPLFDNY